MLNQTKASPTDRAPVRRPLLAILAVVLSAVTLAACGSSSSSGTTAQSAPSGTDVAAKSDVTLPADGPPKAGGNLTYAIEAESDGFDPTQNRWSISGTEIGLAIYDPLAAYDAESNAKPYLAESFTPNATFTQWAVKLRPNVQFHDGTPLTADAVKLTFDKHLASLLTKPAVSNLDRVEVTDALTATFFMKAPWASFPATLTGQLGMVVAPSTLNNPDGSRAPIGTGPFVFKQWIPDQSFTATRNAKYWQKDATGTQLPYLNQVEFRPIPDSQARGNAVQTGDVGMIHTNNPELIKKLRDQAQGGKLQLVEDRGESEEDFVMLNNAKPPFDNLTARQAVAYATDRDQFNSVINLNVLEPADNVFTVRSKYYVNTPFPGFDLAKATQLTQQYEQETGQPLAFTLGDGGTDATNVNQANLLKQQYEAAGMKVDVKLTEQSQFITDAVTGAYQANIWRQFGAPDPDYDRVWWTSESIQPGISLNIARLNDPQLDAALDKGRGTTDEATRKQAYATVQQRFAEELAYIWLDHTLWVIAANNNVRGITNAPLPDGTPSLPLGGPGGFGGVTRLTQTWLTTS